MRIWTQVAKWLDQRFPEKLVVRAEEYLGLHEEVTQLRSVLNDTALSLNKALERLSVVESNAVHKGAVSDLVIAVKMLKEDYASFKANTLGAKPLSDMDIKAMFNGEDIHNG